VKLDELIAVAKKNHGTYEQMVLAVARVLLEDAAKIVESSSMPDAYSDPAHLESAKEIRSLLASLEKEAS
jgi:hypothetical protein